MSKDYRVNFQGNLWHSILTEFLISWKPPRMRTKMNPFVCSRGAVMQKEPKDIIHQKSVRNSTLEEIRPFVSSET